MQLTWRLRDFDNFGFGERPSKANASGRSTFTDGRLRGALLGGGGRWQDPAQLGRVIERTAADDTAIYGRTLIGPDDFNGDAFIGVRRPAPPFGPNVS